jgi:phage head maturation protease
MLVCCRSFVDDDFGPVLADVTRVADDHQLARRRPERFTLLATCLERERSGTGDGGDVIRGHGMFGYLQRSDDHPAGVMAGVMVPYRQDAEIREFGSHFLERFEPGALARTLREDSVRVLFQHGRDPQVGDKPIAVPERLWEDVAACRFETPLLDAAYVRDHVLPGLRAGQFGISFRFRPSLVDHEPPRAGRRLERRRVREARLREFGPVTFPSYSGASVQLA